MKFNLAKTSLILMPTLFLACNDSGGDDNQEAVVDFQLSGEFVEGQTLTINPEINDPDGTQNAEFVYTWYVNDQVVEGVTGNEFAVDASLVDQEVYFVLSYTDDAGNQEQIQSAVYEVEALPNRDAQISFSFSGEFTEEQTVTVSPQVTDEDGIQNAQYAYQWFAQGVEILNANSDSLLLLEDYISQEITVQVSFTDDRGFTESAISDGQTVVMIPNRDAQINLQIVGDFIEEQTLEATVEVSDLDGIENAEYTYTWFVNDQAIDNQGSNFLSLTEENIGQSIYVHFEFEDDRGNTESAQSTAQTVAMLPNRDAQFTVNVTGVYAEQETLMIDAQVTDADGTTNSTITYAWYLDGQLVEDNSTNQIALLPSNNGQEIYFELSMTDDRDNVETYTSEIETVANKTELLGFIGNEYVINVGRQNEDESWDFTEQLNYVDFDTVSDQEIEIFYPHAVTDGKGNIIVAMESEYYEAWGSDVDVVYAYSHDNGQTFSEVDLINTADTTGLAGDAELRIDTDSKGNWVVVWASREDIEQSGGDRDIVFAHSTDNGVSFSAPKIISSYAFADSSHEDYPRIAITENIWTVTWTQSSSIAEGGGNDRDIVASFSEDQGATWSEPVHLNDWATSDSHTDYFPEIDMNESGFAVTAWSGGQNTNDNEVFAVTSQDFGKTWSDPIMINQYGATDGNSEHDYPHRVYITEDNIAVITWRGENQADGANVEVYYSVSTDLGLTWSEERTLHEGNGADGFTDVGLTMQRTQEGLWIATYHRYTQGAFMVTSEDLETWSDPVLLSTDVYDDAIILIH